jgi:hypothetical protein
MTSLDMTSVAITATVLKKAMPYTQIPYGESRLSAMDWEAISTACKGAASLLAALKIEDRRTKWTP